TAHDRAAAVETMTFIKSLEGGVVVPAHPFLAWSCGDKTPQPMLVAYEDARRAKVDVSLPRAIEKTGAAWVILSGTWLEAPLETALTPSYVADSWLDFVLDDLRYVKGVPPGIEPNAERPK